MTRPAASKGCRLVVGAGVMLVAFNLRPALSSVGPLLTSIIGQTGLSAGGAALLTTLPVLCLGLAGALGPLAIRRLGTEAGVLAGLLAIAAGLALRALGTLPALFLGVILAGLGIGLAGVLVPAIVKRDFSHATGRMMGLFTMTLCLGAAFGAGLSVPLSGNLGGWAPSLAVWSLPALAALLAWAPLTRLRPEPPLPARRPLALLRDPLAWQVTGFMGLQSALAYVQFGWLPALLEGRGLSALEAGYLASVTTLGQAPGALIVASLAGRGRDQRAWVLGIILATMLPFLVLAFGPSFLLVPAGIVSGFGVGGCFGLGLTLIVLRARDAAGAGALSAMAQGIGYALASLGPLSFGLAHQASGGWGWPCLLYAGLALAALACGLPAGRDRFVGKPA